MDVLFFPFGTKYRCDFCWMNDNSDGSEWVLVEIEKPKMKLFKANGDPSAELNHAIEQVKSWDRYFQLNPAEKSRIFGAVSKFRLVLVAGRREDWQSNAAAKWRSYHNSTSNIEIHSTDKFYDAIDYYSQRNDNFWSFEENPVSLKSSDLDGYLSSYGYIGAWRNRLA